MGPNFIGGLNDFMRSVYALVHMVQGKGGDYDMIVPVSVNEVIGPSPPRFLAMLCFCATIRYGTAIKHTTSTLDSTQFWRDSFTKELNLY